MSAKATFWAFEQRHLKPTDKLVLLVLANFANERNECWPSYQRIARDAVISRRSAIDIIKRLELLGLIKIEQRRSKDGRQSSNIFRMLVSATAKQIKPQNQSADIALSDAEESCYLPDQNISEEPQKTRVQNLHPPVQSVQIQSADYDSLMVKNLHPPVQPTAPELKNESKNCDGVEEFVTKTASREPDSPKSRMRSDWQPRADFKSHAAKHGVKIIDELDLDDFRRHWCDEHRQLTKAQWENKFLEHLLHRQGMKIKKIKPQNLQFDPELQDLASEIKNLDQLLKNQKGGNSALLKKQLVEKQHQLKIKLAG